MVSADQCGKNPDIYVWNHSLCYTRVSVVTLCYTRVSVVTATASITLANRPLGKEAESASAILLEYHDYAQLTCLDSIQVS